jgi:hypothetical protein
LDFDNSKREIKANEVNSNMSFVDLNLNTKGKRYKGKLKIMAKISQEKKNKCIKTLIDPVYNIRL